MSADKRSRPHPSGRLPRRFFERRRRSILLLLTSLAAIAGIVSPLRDYYRIENRSLGIGLFQMPESGFRISKAILTVDHRTDHDLVTIRTYFHPEPLEGGNSGAVILTVALPATLRPVEEMDRSQWIRRTGRRRHKGALGPQTWYYYRPTASPPGSFGPYFEETFRGSVIASTARESDVRIFFEHLPKHSFPLTVRIFGISDVTVTNPQPQPTRHEANVLEYVLQPELNGYHPTTSLRVFDRRHSYEKEFYIFVAGIFIGLFASLVTNIAWSWVSEQESPIRRTTGRTAGSTEVRQVLRRQRLQPRVDAAVGGEDAAGM